MVSKVLLKLGFAYRLTVIFVAPKWRNLCGPVPKFHGEIHRCFPRHVLKGLVDFPTDDLECFEFCLLDESEPASKPAENRSFFDTDAAVEMAYNSDDEAVRLTIRRLSCIWLIDSLGTNESCGGFIITGSPGS